MSQCNFTMMRRFLDNSSSNGRQICPPSSNIPEQWWRHQMQTFSVLLALCVANSPAPVNFSLKCQWRGALMFSLICVWINGWVNNRENGDLRRYQSHHDVIAMTGLESDRFWMDPFLTNSHTLLYRDCVIINAKHKTLVFRDNQESQMLGRWCVGKICKLIHLSFLWFRWTFVGERYIIDRSLDGDFLKKND